MQTSSKPVCKAEFFWKLGVREMKKAALMAVFIAFADNFAFAECPGNAPMEKYPDKKPAWLEKTSENFGKSWFRVTYGKGESMEEAKLNALNAASYARGAECTPRTCREEDGYYERCAFTDYRYYSLMQFKYFDSDWEHVPQKLLGD